MLDGKTEDTRRYNHTFKAKMFHTLVMADA